MRIKFDTTLGGALLCDWQGASETGWAIQSLIQYTGEIELDNSNAFIVAIESGNGFETAQWLIAYDDSDASGKVALHCSFACDSGDIEYERGALYDGLGELYLRLEGKEQVFCAAVKQALGEWGNN